MAQYHPQQPQYNYTSAGPSISSNVYDEQGDLGVDRPTKKRRNDLGSIVDALYQATLRTQPGEQAPVRINQRKNRNEVYALANAMLVKDIHLNGTKYSRDIALCRGLTTSVHHGDFILILRLDGRILVLSEEAEQHLGKSMRSLYSQCINIFDCLDTTDGNELRSILAASARDQGEEYRLVCTFRLPKGKRPSRVNEDIKTMFMAGHFYSCHDRSSTGDQEKIFVARCHALVSGTTHGTSSSQGDCMVTNSQTMIKIKLNDDMAISDVSSNVEEILGYRRHELMGTWFGRVVATDDLSTFENNRMKCFQSDQAQTATAPTTICDMFDLYTKFGDGRLTFLYQIRPIRERRARTPKFLITAQLIDPSLRNEYSKYLQVETASSNQKKSVKVEQVNLVSPAISKTTEDAVLAYSPSLSGGLLMSDSVSEYGDASQQYSPLRRSLSKHVTPIDFFDPSWPDIFDFNNEHQYLVTNNCDYACSMDQAIDNCFDPFFDPFLMIEDAFF